MFSEVEVGGSALFANVIPNRSYTNTVKQRLVLLCIKLINNWEAVLVRCILPVYKLLLSSEETSTYCESKGVSSEA